MLTFLFLSTTDWDAPQYGSRQQLALQFVRRGHRVLFVEVPRSLHSLVSDPSGTRRALRRLGRRRQIPGGPLVYTPLPVLPLYYRPLMNRFNQRLMHRYLGSVLSKLDWTLDVLWTYWPNTADLAGRLGEQLFVYHCTDLFAAATYPLTTRGTIARMEAEQCRRADLIFTRATSLTADKRQWNSNCHQLPGGIDTSHFDPGRVKGSPWELVGVPEPRAGFVGTLDDRIDIALLRYCAERLSHVTFLFIGPLKRHRLNIQPLQSLPNVHFLPSCPHSRVPELIAAFNVCLIPYLINSYTESVSPVKLYEALAMGKPVVGTALPYLERERDHICLAHTREQFLEGIRAAVSSPPSAEDLHKWRSAAKANSWEQQAGIMEKQVSSLLKRAL